MGESQHRPDASRAPSMLGVLSLLVGLLVAGLALPAAAGFGITTKNAIGDITFSELPASLQSPPLSQLSVIKAADGTNLATFYYENRQSVSLDEVAPTMRQAIVAIEDSRFYEHHGVDPKGILRALLTDTSSGAAVQGASTITQQYVRQALVETNAQDNNTAAAAAATSKNLTRKLTEARYALALEQKLSKDQILEDYLNTVYFGDGAYGISAAAQHYFGETADQLTLAQSALLAGVINNPSTYDPTVNPKFALARRNVVLDRLLVNYPNSYTAAQIDTAKASSLGLNNVVPVPNGCASSTAAFFCDYVVHDILNGPEFGATVTDRANLLRRGGLVVTTTLQPAVQKAAQLAVDTVVPADPTLNAGLAAAIDMVNPKTGAIEAMAVDRPYGTGFGQTEVNLAADYVNHGGSQGRNAGSTFKIFVLAAALEEKIPTGTTIKSPAKITIPKGSTTTCDGLPTSVWNVVECRGRGGRHVQHGESHRGVGEHLLCPARSEDRLVRADHDRPGPRSSQGDRRQPRPGSGVHTRSRAGRPAQRHRRVRGTGQQRHLLHAPVDHQGDLAGWWQDDEPPSSGAELRKGARPDNRRRCDDTPAGRFGQGRHRLRPRARAPGCRQDRH